MLELDSFLADLARDRPLFHSEADFQHAFAWHLHQLFPDARIRLEYPFEIDKWIYVDLWAEFDDVRVAIELKYKTRLLELSYSGELYHLKDQSAQDLGRYDFLKDVQRLEQIARRSTNTVGYAIMLTNYPGYWNQGPSSSTVDAAFRLHESRQITGILEWSDQASPGTTQGRSDPIHLRHEYTINWHQYSRVSDGRGGEFRYVVLEIPVASR